MATQSPRRVRATRKMPVGLNTPSRSAAALALEENLSEDIAREGSSDPTMLTRYTNRVNYSAHRVGLVRGGGFSVFISIHRNRTNDFSNFNTEPHGFDPTAHKSEIFSEMGNEGELSEDCEKTITWECRTWDLLFTPGLTFFLTASRLPRHPSIAEVEASSWVGDRVMRGDVVHCARDVAVLIQRPWGYRCRLLDLGAHHSAMTNLGLLLAPLGFHGGLIFRTKVAVEIVPNGEFGDARVSVTIYDTLLSRPR
ncbi:hypothetical protein FOZ61_001179 [Perkinsus olseni]|uniref:Uncharacterized protein n=1 Tax=Perkinsus olseni TaxID=32597 RepID=A0A7J6KQY0_PEROL|nr:hypothetical protein FOZ61_001179 [Perkinsus olseni]